MRVSTLTSYDSYLSDIMRREAAIQKRSSQIASGVMIQKPSDDPIGTSRTMLLNNSINQLTQYVTNSNNAKSWLNSADSSLQSINDYLSSAYELLMEGANSSISDANRLALAEQMDQISAGIMEVANTNIDNRYIFAGTDASKVPYNLRVTVSGATLSQATPIVIDASNHQFQIKLDNGDMKTISLPVATPPQSYGGSSGKSLEDLARTIQEQLDQAGFAVPVSVKVTSDNKLAFYAGTTPPDGQTHTVLLRNTVSPLGVVDTTLSQLGFADQATTRQLVGTTISGPVVVLGKYPLKGTVAGAADSNHVTLASGSSGTTDFYTNWTLTVTSGPNAGKTATIVGYDPATRQVILGGTGTDTPLTAGDSYSLSPPLTGTTGAASTATDEIYLGGPNDIALGSNFYVGMPITITDGTGQGQTRTIKSVEFDSLKGEYYAKLDSPWTTPPDENSKYSINANYFAAEDSNFKIKVGQGESYEITLDTGSYSLSEFAAQLEKKINAIGGDYANVKVSLTDDNQLRLVYQDPSGSNQTLPITLESGSSADILDKMGFTSGANSDQASPNYEGDHGSINYEINVGVQISVNQVGDSILDSIFANLRKFSQDLRSGDLEALGNEDITAFKRDQQKILVAQGQIGAKVNRIDTGITRMTNVQDNLTATLSNYEDTEANEATMDLKVQQTAYQAALIVASKILPKSLLDYL